MWLSEEIAAGRISAPGWADPRLRAAWLRHRWTGTSAPVIDPLKSINAAKIAAEIGATTLEDIATEYSGASGKANRAKLAQEFRELPPAPWLTRQEKVSVTEGGADKQEDDEEEDES
jgi:capsid protein